MAAIKNVKYLNEESIYQYFHNPNEAFLEGFILNAGKDLHGSTMYVTLFPCNECAKAIIQSGIKRIVYLDDKYRDANNNVAARHMFKITGVETKKYEPSARNISLNL